MKMRNNEFQVYMKQYIIAVKHNQEEKPECLREKIAGTIYLFIYLWVYILASNEFWTNSTSGATGYSVKARLPLPSENPMQINSSLMQQPDCSHTITHGTYMYSSCDRCVSCIYVEMQDKKREINNGPPLGETVLIQHVIITHISLT